ncbi:hypothetical protein D3C71_1362470 [compost metagenome]
MDHGAAFVGHDAFHLGKRGGAVLGQHNFRAIAARHGQPLRVRAGLHHHLGADADRLGGKRRGDGMVARAHGGNSPGALLRRKLHRYV